ncbi:MAG TPA: ROK family protein [Gemmatimonadaceae bacterium]|nr:ROK family protein [Gemmatimonadaceae bacterium]
MPRTQKNKATKRTRSATTRSKRRTTSGPKTLAIDVGGSHVKASVLDARGRMIHDRVRLETPKKVTPPELVSLIAQLVPSLPRFDRVSVGFPGVVRNGVVRTAPNLGTERFQGFNLGRALERRLHKPVRVENDADVQGLAVVKGKGVEMVITLGTGFGSSIFVDGHLGPHLELAHHSFRKDKTYEDELGEAARQRDGDHSWQRHVIEAIDSLRNLTNFDHLYIGGGNSRLLDIELPKDVTVVSNTAGILGGVRLWA